MTKERIKSNYNITVDALPWKEGRNGLFQYAILGPYCIYHDATGYYVTDGNNTVLRWATDLSEYMA